MDVDLCIFYEREVTWVNGSVRLVATYMENGNIVFVTQGITEDI